jgi:DNA (cytosine-5)-methyltransferase 1
VAGAFHFALLDPLFDSHCQLRDGPPKVVVRRVHQDDTADAITAIKAQLKLMGYESDLRILSAEEYGTPQVRRRVFIVASRVAEPADLLPVATHRSADPRKAKGKKRGLKRMVTVFDAISDLPAIANGGGEKMVTRSGKALTSFQKASRRGTRKVFNHMCHALTKVNMDRMVHVPEGGNWRNIPRALLPAGMQRAELSDHTKRYGRLSRGGLASTLLTKCDPHWGAYIHPTQDRTISVREAARLQGFPDIFRFAGDYLGKHYEQVGNAVPVPVARAIGLAVSMHVAKAKFSSSDLQLPTDSGGNDQLAA